MVILPYSILPSMKRRIIRCGDSSVGTNGNKPNFVTATSLQFNVDVAEFPKIKGT